MNNVQPGDIVYNSAGAKASYIGRSTEGNYVVQPFSSDGRSCLPEAWVKVFEAPPERQISEEISLLNKQKRKLLQEIEDSQNTLAKLQEKTKSFRDACKQPGLEELVYVLESETLYEINYETLSVIRVSTKHDQYIHGPILNLRKPRDYEKPLNWVIESKYASNTVINKKAQKFEWAFDLEGKPTRRFFREQGDAVSYLRNFIQNTVVPGVLRGNELWVPVQRLLEIIQATHISLVHEHRVALQDMLNKVKKAKAISNLKGIRNLYLRSLKRQAVEPEFQDACRVADIPEKDLRDMTKPIDAQDLLPLDFPSN